MKTNLLPYRDFDLIAEAESIIFLGTAERHEERLTMSRLSNRRSISVL